jgi:hypothetical protein
MSLIEFAVAVRRALRTPCCGNTLCPLLEARGSTAMDGIDLQTYNSLRFARMHEAQLLDASPLALELRG